MTENNDCKRIPSYWSKTEENRILNQFLSDQKIETNFRTEFAVKIRLGKILSKMDITNFELDKQNQAKEYIDFYERVKF